MAGADVDFVVPDGGGWPASGEVFVEDGGDAVFGWGAGESDEVGEGVVGVEVDEEGGEFEVGEFVGEVGGKGCFADSSGSAED